MLNVSKHQDIPNESKNSTHRETISELKFILGRGMNSDSVYSNMKRKESKCEKSRKKEKKIIKK